MIELFLIFGVIGAATIAAVLLARWALARGEGSAEALRVSAAVARAGDEFGWRVGKRALGVALLVGTAASFAAVAESESATPAAATAALGVPEGFAAVLAQSWSWALGGTLLGAVGCFLTGQLGLQIGARASSRVAAVALKTSQAQIVAVALRGGAAIAIGAELLALLAVLGPLGLLPFGFETLFDTHAVFGLGGLAMGATAAALVSQLAGTSVHFAGLQTRREPPFGPARERYQLQAQNPGLILDLMGQQAGVSVVRAQNAFCTALLSYLALLLLVARWGPNSSGALDVRLLLVLVLLRALGILAGCFSVLSLRADEGDDPSLVLWRGQLAAVVLSLAGLCGALVWSMGTDWLAWFAAGALGLMASASLGLGQRLSSERRYEPALGDARELPSSGATAASLALGRVLGRALNGAWRPLVVIAITSALAAFMGANSSQPEGAVRGLCLLLTGLGMALPYANCLALFEPILETGFAQASLDPVHQRPDFHQRAQRLGLAAANAGQVGTSHGNLLTLVLALLLGTTLLRGSNLEPIVSSVHFAWAGALLGLVAILGFSAITVQHVLGCSASTLSELHSQLRDLPRDAEGRPRATPGFRPRYSETLAAACEGALSARGLLVLGVTLLPWVLVSLLPMLGTHDTTLGRSLLLSSLLACAGLAGTALSLLSRAALGALHATRRGRTGPDSVGALQVTEGLADLCGNVLDPSLQLVAKGTLAACLAIAPTLLTVH